MAGLPTITGTAFIPSIKDDMVKFPQNGGDPFGTARGKFSQRWFDKDKNDWQEARETWVDLNLKGALLQRFVNEHQQNSTITFVGEFFIREYATIEGEKRQAAVIDVKAFEFEKPRGQQGNQQQGQQQQGQQQGNGGFGGNQGQQQGGGFGGNQQQGQQQGGDWGQPPQGKYPWSNQGQQQGQQGGGW